METKNIIKGYNVSESMGTPSNEDFEIIKEYVSSDTLQSDLFIYKLKLCDNEVDRDFEQFSPECLTDIASLFSGKVGVYDHEWQSSNIHSRIYKAYPVIVEDKTNSQGEPYTYVEAYAYTTNENKELINEIKKGLKKEVSVGVRGSQPVCSICGLEHCEHQKGLYYSDKLCYNIIKNVDDAYEFSFVAVNSQKAAGVEKKYNNNKGGLSMDVRKSLLTLAQTHPQESNELLKAFEDMEKEESVKVKELMQENENLKAKLKEYEDKEEAIKKAEYIKSVLGDLSYRNDKAKGFGDTVINENNGMEAEELHNLLVVDYGFLFENVENVEEVVEELVEDIEETVEVPTEEEVVEAVEDETIEKEVETTTEEVKEEEVVEKAEEDIVEEETVEDKDSELKEMVEKKLKAFKSGKLNVEGLSSNLNREVRTKKVQSGMRITLN